jgi:hypothetical protein
MIDRRPESQFISTLDSLQKKYKTEFKLGTNQMTKEAVFAITKKIQTTAHIALAEMIKAHSMLSKSFDKIDKPQEYLKIPNFRGRTLLTRARLNDIP